MKFLLFFIDFLNDMSDNLISNRIKTIKFKDIKWGKSGEKWGIVGTAKKT
jgi:hypothetical protein